jgi:hypothetical protein
MGPANSWHRHERQHGRREEADTRLERDLAETRLLVGAQQVVDAVGDDFGADHAQAQRQALHDAAALAHRGDRVPVTTTAPRIDATHAPTTTATNRIGRTREHAATTAAARGLARDGAASLPTPTAAGIDDGENASHGLTLPSF